VQCIGKDPARLRVVLSDDLVDAWHPAIARAVLKNWQMGEDVCDAVGAQSELAVRRGPPTLTDVLVAASAWRVAG
jgi:HD-like signal output (HDOD) protein